MPGYLTNAPSDIVAHLLVQLGLGTLASGTWPIYVNNEPDSPDNVITCYDFLGLQHGRTMPDGERQHHDGVQIRVRAMRFTFGWAKVRDISLAIDRVSGCGIQIDIAEYNVQSIMSGGIVRLGTEPTSKRQLWVINCQMSVRQCN
jgi:hypothetical protein